MSLAWARIVWTLLKAARVRAKARTLAAMKTRNPKRQSSSSTLTVLAFLGAMLFALGSAFIFTRGATLVQEVAAEKRNQYFVNSEQLDRLAAHGSRDDAYSSESLEAAGEYVLYDIAHDRYFAEPWSVRKNSDSSVALAEVKKHFDKFGSGGFVESKELFDIPTACSLLALMLAMWWLSLVLQSDGIELDTTRRRHIRCGNIF